MGITGLLPILTKVQKKVNLKDFKGKRIAVDGNVWLHRGAVACAQELALNQTTTAYITYFMKQVDLLRYHGVDPVIVFDGDSLPIKKHTNELRRRKRESAYGKALDHLRLGELQLAADNFQKAIQITPHMTNEVIKVLKSSNVKYVHAPYEADPQLTYLCNNGLVSAVLTEDSDMLVFGCATVLFKLDPYGGAIQIRHQDLFCNMNNGFDFTSWDTSKFRHMCMISGCDYLPSISGVGLKTAYNMLTKHKTIDKTLPVLQSMAQASPSYTTAFRKAEEAFLYQHIYAPKSKSCIPMTKLPENKSMADYEHLGANPNVKLQPSKAMPSQPLSVKSNTITENTTKSGPFTIDHTKNRMKEYPGKENIPPSACESRHGSIDMSIPGALSKRPTFDNLSKSFITSAKILGKRKSSQSQLMNTNSNSNKKLQLTSTRSLDRCRGADLSSPVTSPTTRTTEMKVRYVTKWGTNSYQGVLRQYPTLEPTNCLVPGKPTNYI